MLRPLRNPWKKWQINCLKMRNQKSLKDEYLSNYERLLRYSLWLISKRRYTCYEIRKKMQRFFKKHKLEQADDMDRVVDRLIELKYLNDPEYARDYVSDRIRFNPRGKFLLKKELKSKGIAPETITAVLAHIDVDEFEMALELLKKKRFILSPETSDKDKARAYRFLASRGFGKEIVYKAIQSQYNRY